MTNKIKTVTTGYTPRPLQQSLHNSLKRFNALVCHRGFGKTVFVVNDTVDRALRNLNKNPQYAYIAPNYGQAKRISWEPFKDCVKNIPGVDINEAELRIDIPRPHLQDKVRIMLLGAENPNSIRGIHLDGAPLDEYAEMHPSVWTQVVRPALSIKKGWATFIGTPKGKNHFYEVLQAAKADPENWFWCIHKASETGVVPKEELELARATMSEEEYNQEYECSFTAAMVGSYYGKYIEDSEKSGRITRVPYDPSTPVDTFWDLGVGDTTVIWFVQQVHKEFHVIDYYEMSGMGLDHYAKILKEKPYVYGEHVLPHDAAARSLETGRTRQETLTGHGIKPTRILERSNPEDGINAARVLLPRCWFDLEKCRRGIEALTAYERKWDAKNKIFSDAPLHNWASNGADGFRTFAMGVRDKIKRPNASDLPRQADSDYDIFDTSRTG